MILRGNILLPVSPPEWKPPRGNESVVILHGGTESTFPAFIQVTGKHLKKIKMVKSSLLGRQYRFKTQGL